MAVLKWGVRTDPGRIRQQNEDSVLVQAHLFAVADGMGGHKAGEVASALTVEKLQSRLGTAVGSLDDVLAAVVDANGEIFRAATENIDQQGMGTTLTGLFVVTKPADPTEGAPAGAPSTESFALINVGDSRTYLLRHGRLRRVTMDHNYVQELVNTGHITDDEARTHPRRNIITRALGIDPSVRVDAWTLPIVRGDRFVLCSDGLSDEVHDNEIHQIVTTVSDPQDAANELVAAANRAGGRDNISAVVVDVVEGLDPPAPDDELDIEPVWEPDADIHHVGARRPVVDGAGRVRGPRRVGEREGRPCRHAPVHPAGHHRGSAGRRHPEPPAPCRRVHRRRRRDRRADPGVRHRRGVCATRLLRCLRRRRRRRDLPRPLPTASCGGTRHQRPQGRTTSTNSTTPRSSA